jgi:hypothetical protein
MSECEINKADSLCTFLTPSIKIFEKKYIFVIILIRGLSHCPCNDRGHDFAYQLQPVSKSPELPNSVHSNRIWIKLFASGKK